MKIAVNTRLLLTDRLEGMGRFSDEILQRVVRRMNDCQFTFLFDRDFDRRFIYAENVQGKALFPQARHPFLYRWWLDRSIPLFLRRNPHDVLLSPDGFIPLKGRTPTVNVLHDINFEHFDGLFDEAHYRYFRKYMPRFARHATRLATVSEFSRFDLSTTYHIPEDRITVVPNGVSDRFHPTSAVRQAEVRKEVSSGHPYFVFVGSLNLRKNIPFLLRAFDRFCDKSEQKIRLILVGSEDRMAEAVRHVHRNMTNASRVVFTGRIPDERLVEILGSALALTFVPLFEGFGIPLVEAFACELPVITTNVSALPEVAEEAALYVDPYMEDELVAAMLQISKDDTLRLRLVEAGKKRAAEYSWDKSAETVERLIREAADGTA